MSLQTKSMILAGLLSAVASAPLLEGAAPQEGESLAPAGSELVADAGTSAAVETSAEELRSRIREMRMNLLLGGDQVRKAEREATAFYTDKSRSVERRIDDVSTELTELRASYEIALDRVLEGRGTAAGAEAQVDAQQLRSQIVALESEVDGLETRRGRLSELVAAVDERDRDRQRLVDQLETSSVGLDNFAAPMMGIGLAPNVAVDAMEAGASLADGGLFDDLYARDPRGARALLYAEDPDAYWNRFPLTPPARELRSALGFPRPDPVGRR